MDYKRPKYKIGDIVVAKWEEENTPFFQMIIKSANFRKGEWYYNAVEESLIIEKL